MKNKNTTTHYIHWAFSEYESCGYGLYVLSWKAGDDSTFRFLKEVEIPNFDKTEIVKAGVSKIDNDITDLRHKINKLEDKKQQLLALGHETTKE